MRPRSINSRFDAAANESPAAQPADAAGVSVLRRVLVVDQLEETHEVLRSILERRGMQILSANQPEEGLAMARDEQPDLIVLDLEIEPLDAAVADRFEAEAKGTETPVVVLGTVRPRSTSREEGRFLAKPYHYGQLIHTIDDLLARRSSCDTTPVG